MRVLIHLLIFIFTKFILILFLFVIIIKVTQPASISSAICGLCIPVKDMSILNKVIVVCCFVVLLLSLLLVSFKLCLLISMGVVPGYKA